MAYRLPPQEEIPTPEAVATAIVAAARVLGEDPAKLTDPNALMRCRWPALAALNVFYPDMAWSHLGAMVDVAASPRIRLTQAQGSRWWKPLGEQALAAAINALESL